MHKRLIICPRMGNEIIIGLDNLFDVAKETTKKNKKTCLDFLKLCRTYFSPFSQLVKNIENLTKNYY